MYAVTVRGQANEGRMEDLKNHIVNNAIPNLDVPGMISIGFCNPMENINLGMAFLEDKEAADRFAEARGENIAVLGEVLAGPPKVVEGEVILGNSPLDPVSDLPIRKLRSITLSQRATVVNARTVGTVPAENLIPFVHQRYDDLSVLGVKDTDD